MKTKKNSYYDSYHPPSCSNIYRVKKNAIFISNTNTVLHELGKCLAAIQLHRHGDVLITPKMKEALKIIDQECNKTMLPKQKTDFITEASPNKEKLRIDLVNIQDNTRFEIVVSSPPTYSECIIINLT